MIKAEYLTTYNLGAGYYKIQNHVNINYSNRVLNTKRGIAETIYFYINYILQ